MIRIVCVSDTHSLHDQMLHNIPEGDILIHSGDCTNKGIPREIEEFVNWYKSLKGFKNKIFIAGNHDFGFESLSDSRDKNIIDWYKNLLNKEKLLEYNVHYLQDSGITLDLGFSRPLKIWGSPWQPEFFNWAFNLPRLGSELKEKWNLIPDDTNILVTHGPAKGILDLAPKNLKVGCELLRLRINEIKPLLHVFGHIHLSYGVTKEYDTMFANASICTEKYRPSNQPLVFDVFEENEKLIVTNVKS